MRILDIVFAGLLILISVNGYFIYKSRKEYKALLNLKKQMQKNKSIIDDLLTRIYVNQTKSQEILNDAEIKLLSKPIKTNKNHRLLQKYMGLIEQNEIVDKEIYGPQAQVGLLDEDEFMSFLEKIKESVVEVISCVKDLEKKEILACDQHFKHIHDGCEVIDVLKDSISKAFDINTEEFPILEKLPFTIEYRETQLGRFARLTLGASKQERQLYELHFYIRENISAYLFNQ